MLLSFYTPSRAKKLEKLVIPEITEPFPIKILWMQSRSDKDAAHTISLKQHQHSFFEMHFILSGSFIYETSNSGPMRIDENHGILVYPEIPHKIRSHSPKFIKLTLAFLPSPYSLFHTGADAAAYPFALSEKMNACIQEIFTESDEKNIFSMTIISHRILDILYEFCRGTAMRSAAAPLPEETRADIKIAIARQYIDDNRGVLLTCAEVAEQCHFNVKYLSRVFKTQTGVSLLDYIHSKKMKEAETLLLQTNDSLSEISMQLGFKNEYYFNSFFKRRSGLTPGTYRRLIKKQ